jgi:hypothetical protein
MHNRFVLVVALSGLTNLARPAVAAPRARPAGKVTCQEWCAVHPERRTCMTGHPNSCDRKPQGARTCVRIWDRRRIGEAFSAAGLER